MKKNKFMKLASGLLVLCLMTTCVIGATLAKYVTSGSGSDQARVAKWGVKISAVANSAFKTQYDTEDAEYTGDLSVKSSSTDEVVAPGTEGNAAQFSISGKPEVAVRLSFKMTAINGTDPVKDIMLAQGTYTYDDGSTVEVGEGGYYPVVFTLTHSTRGTLETGTLSKIAEYLNTHPVDVAPGDISTAVGTYTLSWKWAFDDDEDIGVNDKADTLLGDLAAGVSGIKKGDSAIATSDYSTEVSYNLTITATQID